jgi:hypothetical protein
VEIGKIGGALASAGDTIARALPTPGIAPVSELVIVSFVVLGFLAGFLWTRISDATIQTSTDAGIRRMLTGFKRTPDATREKTNQVADFAESLAGSRGNVRGRETGSIGAGPTSSLEAIMADWPPEVRERVNRFLEFDADDYYSDPTADLFTGAPRAAERMAGLVGPPSSDEQRGSNGSSSW